MITPRDYSVTDVKLHAMDMDASAAAFLLVLISSMLAAYELNLFLVFLSELAYSREALMYQCYLEFFKHDGFEETSISLPESSTQVLD